MRFADVPNAFEIFGFDLASFVSTGAATLGRPTLTEEVVSAAPLLLVVAAAPVDDEAPAERPRPLLLAEPPPPPPLLLLPPAVAPVPDPPAGEDIVFTVPLTARYEYVRVRKG